MPVGKIIELVGTSSRGFETRSMRLSRVSKTVKNIRGVDVVDRSDCQDGKSPNTGST